VVLKSHCFMALLCLCSVDSVRLENGSSRCSGRLEVKSNNWWSSVCQDDFDLLDAEVVCRELGCGAPSVLQGALYGEAEAPILSREFLCEGHESVLLDCGSSWRKTKACPPDKAVGLTCSDSVRLENGSSRCSGRLEVKSNNWWSSVCEDDFDLLDAEVVCRELGCGAPSVLQGALYGEAEAPILSREFLCEGHESVLLDCGSSWRKTKACPPDKAVGLTCSGWSSVLDRPVCFSVMGYSVRLENGSSRCSGRLEVKSNNSWSSVCEDDFDLLDAEVVCRELGCGAPSVLQGALYGEAEAPILSREFLCEGHESVLLDCGSSWRKTKACPPDKAVGLTCSGTAANSVRLENGSSRCSGRLEVKSNNWWSSVCEDDFDLLDAEVVCRELGCGAPSVLQGALYGEAEAPKWNKEFLCKGHESSLLDCNHARLERNVSHCAGTLEMFYGGEWGPVAASNWSRDSASAVCAQLGCGSALSTRSKDNFLNRSVWWIQPPCGPSLEDCSYSASHYTTMQPPCKSINTLINGSSRCSGRLEVKSNNWWSSVCEDDFDLLDAEVVCRELGCGAPSVLQGALYGEAEAPILSREFLCEGHESVLQDCGSSWRKTKACPPDKAVGLTCSGTAANSVRLENGSSRCSGRLEVKSNNSWSSVCEDDFDLLDAEVVCRELGCGAPSVLQGALYGEAEAPILSREFLCEGHESVLQDCGSSWRKTKACPPDKAVGLTCSGTAGKMWTRDKQAKLKPKKTEQTDDFHGSNSPECPRAGVSSPSPANANEDEPDEEIILTTILTEIKSFHQDKKQQLREIKEEIGKSKIRLDEAEERIVNAEERLQSMEKSWRSW
uniref:SRCR domain-containing protein n=1 Tax=Oryzias latipes TaxID=8090 RepID=A0A3P9HNW3_ORYLA